MVKTQHKVTPIENFIKWIGSIQSMIFHSLIFIAFFVLTLSAVASRDLILLIWNTIVSLEAIYLAIFIQFTVNRHTTSLREVEEDIDEIQEDVEELGEDMDEIQEDLGEMQENLEEITEDDTEEEKQHKEHTRNLEALTADMRQILNELEALKKKE